MPATARHRDVYFFPARDSPFAQVIVGGPIISEKRVMAPAVDLTTPMGCYLHATEHLGGWVAAESLGKGRKSRDVGHFNVALEQFDPDVDCVRE